MINNTSVKRYIRQIPLYRFIKPVYWRWEIIRWSVRGKTAPLPRLLKQQTVRHYADVFRLDTLIETGTYEGDMVASQLNTFGKIHTIELDPQLCEQARLRFSLYQHVAVYCGDSGELLPQLVAQLNGPALFWLDAHYSGGITALGELETPVLMELSIILSHPYDHVILVDDAREFVGAKGYPSLESARNLVQQKRPGWIIEVKEDIIRIGPAHPKQNVI